MNQAVSDSLKGLKDAFAHRSRPRSVPHCQMCYRDEEIAKFLALPDEALLEDELRPVTRDGYVCWGTWKEVAYYIPRLLELWADDLIVESDRLFMLILYAIRPETGFWTGDPRQDCDMDEAERTAIADFVGEALLSKMSKDREEDCVWRMLEPVTFLGCFREPIAPLLERMAQHEDPHVRGNFALFLTDCAGSNSAPAIWWEYEPKFLPANKRAFDDWREPSTLAQYLLDHTSDVAIFGIERARDIDAAFDYLMKPAAEPRTA